MAIAGVRVCPTIVLYVPPDRRMCPLPIYVVSCRESLANLEYTVLSRLIEGAAGAG